MKTIHSTSLALLLMMALAPAASAQMPAPPRAGGPMDFGLMNINIDPQGPHHFQLAAPPAASEKPAYLYQWQSGHVGHNRLLFEEPKLERQGIARTGPVQLAQSSALFFSRSILFPINFAFGKHRQPQ